jgi:hypothetical protein
VPNRKAKNPAISTLSVDFAGFLDGGVGEIRTL